MRLILRNNYIHLLFGLIVFYTVLKLSFYTNSFISIVPDQWTVILGLEDSIFQNHVGNTFPITRIIAMFFDGLSAPFQAWYIFNLIVWVFVLTTLYANLIIGTSSKIISILAITLFISNPKIYSNFALPYSQTHWSLPLLIVLIYCLFLQKQRTRLFGLFHAIVLVLCYLAFSSSIVFVNVFILSVYILVHGVKDFWRKESLKFALLFLITNLVLLILQEKISFRYPSVDPGANIKFFGENYFQNAKISFTLFSSFLMDYIKSVVFWLYEVLNIAIFLSPLYIYILVFKMKFADRLNLILITILFNVYIIIIFIVRYNGEGILNYDRYYIYIFLLIIIPFGYVLKHNPLSQKITVLCLIPVIIFRFLYFDTKLNEHLGTSQISSREQKTLYTQEDFERSWAIKIVQVCLKGDEGQFNELASTSVSTKLDFVSTCKRVDHWFSGHLSNKSY